MKIKIKYKLFFAMLLANLLVIVGIYFLFIISFNSSFKSYLDAHQEEKLSGLIFDLENQYLTKSSWNWLKRSEKKEWRKLLEGYLSKYVGSTKRKRKPPLLGNNEKDSNISGPERRRRFAQRESIVDEKYSTNEIEQRPPPFIIDRTRKFEISPMLFLLDKNKNIIIGPPDVKEQKVKWLHLKNGNKLIGYLGYHRTEEVTSDLDQIFINKLQENLSWSIFLVVIISALITIELARRLVKPIIKLREATKYLSQGLFHKKLNIVSNDEFAQLYNDFNSLADTLESNLTARHQWIADISHELRTPVAVLRAELEAVQDGVHPLNERLVNSLHQDILRLTSLINDLHELSLSDSGDLSYKFERVDIIELIDGVIKSKDSLIESSNIAVTSMIESPVKEIVIDADRNRLIQLFTNLMNNSLNYTNTGGKIEIKICLSRNNVEIQWQDSEPAVTEQQLKKLFERLYRVESSRNRNMGGSGLGLSICKSIMEAHRGNIRARHSPIGGVQFIINFPSK